MAGVRAGGRLSARAQNPGRLRLPERNVAAPPAPRILLSCLPCPLSVDEVCECAYYPQYLSVNLTGDAYVKMEYRLILEKRAGQSLRR